MYLLSQRIKAMGNKVVLSGEGADEIFGGYLYFHKAPSPGEAAGWGAGAGGGWRGTAVRGAATGGATVWAAACAPATAERRFQGARFAHLPTCCVHSHSPPPHHPTHAEEYHKECVRLVTRLHQWDVLRANKAPFAFGLETRVPFLDKQFLQVGREGGECVWVGGWVGVLCGQGVCVWGACGGRGVQPQVGACWAAPRQRMPDLACMRAAPCSRPCPCAGAASWRCSHPAAVTPLLSNHPLPPQVSMNIDPRDKMPNLAEKPDGVHPKLEKYILRKVGHAVPAVPAVLCCAALALSSHSKVMPPCRPSAHPGPAPPRPPPPAPFRRLTSRSGRTCPTTCCSGRRSSSATAWATTGWTG